MKVLTLLGILVLVGNNTLFAQNLVATLVTCKTTTPGAKRSDYLALANDCTNQQAACDQYKTDPFYGPAKAISCEPFYNLTKLQGTLKKEFAKGRRFPGYPPSSLILCKTKAGGETYGMVGSSCEAGEQKQNCDKYAKDIATPSSCVMYPSVDWLESDANKYLPTYGIECQITGSAVPFRIAVPDCSTTLKNNLCDPTSGKVLNCKKWNDPQALKQWAEAIPMTGFVTCRLNDMPLKSVHHIPARDCTPAAQKDACGTWGTPTGCLVKDIEKLRQEQALQKG